MPIYEYSCRKCGKRFEKIQRMNEEHSASCCGVPAARVFQPARFKIDFKAGYEPGLRQYVGTKREREYLMKERGLIDYPYDD